MVFYGTRSLTCGQKILNGMLCAKCGNDGFVLTNHYMSAHMFWIPFMWVISFTVGYCPGCNKRMPLKRLNKKYGLGLTKDQMKEIKSELYSQMPEDKKKYFRNRNIIGIVTFSIFVLVIAIAILSSLLKS